MIELSSLFSGSSGNATLADNGSSALLVDCGVSGKRLAANLSEDEIGRLCGILVTHEHIDHIAGVGVAARKWNLPVYATEGTLAGMGSYIGNLPEVHIIEAGKSVSVGDFSVSPFSIPHDASEPVGFRLSDGESEAGVATDMGYMNRALLRNILGCRSVLLESNHDMVMLETGPYPPYLKNRIRGEKGHLSNRTAAISSILLAEYGTEKILLGHLSKENNTPEKALECTSRALCERGFSLGAQIKVAVAGREVRSSL